MNILITGATGGLGHSACQWAYAQGHHVIATGRNQSVLDTLARQGIRTYALDLAVDELGVLPFDDPQVGKIDAVWHCAALSSPWGRYPDFYAANVTATDRLVAQAVSAGVPYFVHISTPSLYFDYQHHRDVLEDYQAKRFANHYIRTKALAETTIRQAATAYPDTRFVILRPRAIYGEYDQVLLPRLLSVVDERGYLPLPRGGQAVMDFCDALNVAYAMLLASRPNPKLTSGDAFNITNHEPLPLIEVLKLFFAALDRPLTVKSLPYPVLMTAANIMQAISALTQQEPKLTPYSVGALHYDMTLSPARASTLLGYTPLHTTRSGLLRTAHFFKQQTPRQHV